PVDPGQTCVTLLRSILYPETLSKSNVLFFSQAASLADHFKGYFVNYLFNNYKPALKRDIGNKEESDDEDHRDDMDLENDVKYTIPKDLRSRRISRGLVSKTVHIFSRRSQKTYRKRYWQRYSHLVNTFVWPFFCLSSFTQSNQIRYYGNASNGLSNSIMGPIWSCTETTKKFRDEYCNKWVFPEWIPSEKDWRCISNSNAEKYLPQEMVSPAFTCSREGIKEHAPLHRMKRFEGLPPDPKRWDMMFYTGGPVWAMDWCPTPDGAPANQYAAIYSHKDLDHQHRINKLYTEPGLIQIWNLGQLQYNTSPPSPPGLAYGIAQDKGFVWNLKWCPGGAWELPTTNRKAPHMPRLGLLAASSSDGHISIYSLPHPDAVLARGKPTATGEPAPRQLAVITLKRGSFKANHDEKATQVLSMDWLPVKPHNILAAGFYDGTVVLWDLSSRSALQRVRDPDRSHTLFPYHCFMAHDNGARALSFCHASRDLMVTAGDDRMVKMWDLRRTWEPCQSFKRFLSTEAAWPLHWAGVFVSQESTYGTFGQHGLNYFDSGYLGFKPLFLVPRKGTMWSLSISDWLNTAVTSDSLGDVIMVLLPNLFNNPCYLKRSIDRRFVSTLFDRQKTPKMSTLETATKYYLHYHDMDMTTFKNVQNRAPWKHMQASEVKGGLDLDLMPLASINKIRMNPNLCAQSWVLSGGQAGLVRAHCLSAMNSSHINKMVQDSQAQFNAMFMQNTADSQGDASAVRHTTEKL
uniref:General transcription factor 3C polypeptide 2 n=1 Tax=Esox lucius TaxID=8010 RepID=A0A3P8Z9W5_ESOLU